jgi:hypothetical protein
MRQTTFWKYERKIRRPGGGADDIDEVRAVVGLLVRRGASLGRYAKSISSS